MNTILEVAIGLFFVFLLFSLLVSAVNEAVFGHLTRLRSRVLEDGLHEILSKQAKGFSLMAWISRGFKSPPQSGAATFSEQLIQHPLIQGLTVGSQRCPSYIPGETFADAALGTLMNLGGATPSSPPASPSLTSVTIHELMDVVSQLPDPNARKVFSSVLAGAVDLEEARERLETWFNNSMERVSGAYKRYSQFWLLVWAMIVVVGLNVDTIEITKRLLSDAQFRSSLASGAIHFITQPGVSNSIVLTGNASTPGGGQTSGTNQSATNVISGAAFTPSQLLQDAGELNLPIGWRARTQGTNANLDASLFTGGTLASPPPLPSTLQGWWLKLFGLLITIAAISQGAPFWFDLLNRVANLRAVGRPPERRDDGDDS